MLVFFRPHKVEGCKRCLGYPPSRTPPSFIPMNGAKIVTPAYFDDITHRRIVREGGINHVEQNRGRVYSIPK